jgi:type III restriction enzyme
VQTTNAGGVNWIVEMKGRVWEGTAAKGKAIKDWGERVNAATGVAWR